MKDCDECFYYSYDGYDDERLTWTREQIFEDVKNNDFLNKFCNITRDHEMCMKTFKLDLLISNVC